MATPEELSHQNENQEKKKKKSEGLIGWVKNLFKEKKTGKEDEAKKYLEEEAQNKDKLEDPDPVRKQEAVSKRTEKQQELNELKGLITTDKGSKDKKLVRADSVITQTKKALDEAAKETGGKDSEFLTKLKDSTVPPEAALPFARYVVKTLERGASPSAAEAEKKIQDALEIFYGETGKSSEGMKALKTVIDSTLKTHPVNEDYVKSELPDILTYYDLSTSDNTEILAAALGTVAAQKKQEEPDASKKKEDENVDDKLREQEELIKRLEEEQRKLLDAKENKANVETIDIRRHKENLLSKFDADPEQKAKLDLHLLSLPPKKVLQLLKLAPEPKIDRQSLYSQYEPRPEYRDAVKGLVDEWLADAPEINFVTPEVKEEMVTYFHELGERLDRRRESIAPKRKFVGQTETAFQTAVNSLKDDYVAAYLMLSSQDGFLFNEFFKGKVAQQIKERTKKDGKSVEEFLALARKGPATEGNEGFVITQKEIYEDLFREVKQTVFYKFGQSEFSRMWTEIDQGIRRAKELTEVKAPLEVGGVRIKFQYEKFQEQNVAGPRTVAESWDYDSSLAHVTGVYLVKAQRFETIYNSLNTIATEMEKGDAEKFVGAAEALSNEQLDLLLAESPIIMQAYSSYLKHIESRIAMNGGILTPDLLERSLYGKVELDKLIEDDLKATYTMTDSEREVYLKIGKALTVASGDLISILSRALPPLDSFMDVKEFENSEVGRRIIDKRKKGEPLSLSELKEFEKRLQFSFHDFPYRGLLMSINPTKWLHAWIEGIDSDTQHNLLGYVPVTVGKTVKTPFEMYGLAQKIRDSIYYGVTDETQEYMSDPATLIPVLDLDHLNPTVTASLGRRGGWRGTSAIFLRRDMELRGEKDGSGNIIVGSEKIDGDATFQKLLEKSPFLAHQFLVSPPSYIGVPIDWGGGKDKPDRLEYTKRVMKYMHKTNPTIFMNKEERRFFRRDENSFNESVQQLIINTNGPDRKNGYWMFLNANEQADTFSNSIQPSKLGPEYQADAIRASRVAQRMTQVMMAAETRLRRVLSERQAEGKAGVTLEDYFSKAHNEELLKTTPELMEIHAAVQDEIKKIQGLYSAQGSLKDIHTQFLRFGNEVFYAENSIFKKQKFKGMYAKKNEDHKATDILTYYSTLITKDKMLNPFDWTYMNDVNMSFQRTGLNMIKRNLSDFGGYVKYTKAWGDMINTQKDAIRLRDKKETIKLLKGAVDKFGESIPAIASTYGEPDADRMGYLAMVYLQQPFMAGRAKDVPLFGLVPGMASWATMMNKDDIWKQNILTLREREEIMDHAEHKPLSKRMISSRVQNKQFSEFKTHFKLQLLPDKKDKQTGKPIPGSRSSLKIPIPGFLAKFFPDFPGVMDYKKLHPEGTAKDFSMESLRKQLKLERWWYYGNMFATIFMVGALLVLFQSIKDGMKELEMK